MHKIKQRRNEIIDGGVISLAVVFCRKPRYSISGSLKNGAEMPRFFVPLSAKRRIGQRSFFWIGKTQIRKGRGKGTGKQVKFLQFMVNGRSRNGG